MNSNGNKVLGRKSIGGCTYWFSGKDGHRYTGWRKINGYRYYFGNDGAMRKNQWFYSGGNWYYFLDSGRACTGVRKINGCTYGFASSGRMCTGKTRINGKTYYFGSDGVATDGTGGHWVQSGKYWYWYYSNGKMARNTLVDNGRYYVAKDGVYTPLSGKYATQSYGLPNGPMYQAFIHLYGGISGTYKTSSTNSGERYLPSGTWKCTGKTWTVNGKPQYGKQSVRFTVNGSSKVYYGYIDDISFPYNGYSRATCLEVPGLWGPSAKYR